MTAPGAHILAERRRLEGEVKTLKAEVAVLVRDQEVRRLLWALVLIGYTTSLEEKEQEELAEMECCPECGEPGFTSTCGACWHGRQGYTVDDVPFGG